jgi:hypothetical protein
MPERKPPLSIVKTRATGGLKPARKLGKTGLALWNTIMAEYQITDAGGAELLLQICGASDRLDAIGNCIAADGETIRTKTGMRAHPLLREETALRAFVSRTIERLGLNIETVKPVGRPPGRVGWARALNADD